jgi:hypothetical protein
MMNSRHFGLALAALALAPLAWAQTVAVSSTTPSSAAQGTVNLNVTISGKGFKNGAISRFFVTGTTDSGGIAVNSTTYSSPTQLVANISVSSTAVISGFDVQVDNTDGHSGKGSNIFNVIQGGNAASTGSCTSSDHPVRMYFSTTATMPDGVNTVPSAVFGDGNWYTDGTTDGNGSIHICGGTRDATFNISTKRALNFNFPGKIPGSYDDVKIAAGTYSSTGVFLNVRNILCNGCTVDPHLQFTTHMTFANINIGGKSFQLRFQPVTVDAPDADPGVPLAEENTPFFASPVLVIPQPYNCNTGGAVKPSWVVRGTVTTADPLIPAGYSLQVGTAHQRQSNGTMVRAGQYSMPFELRIESLDCFTY